MSSSSDLYTTWSNHNNRDSLHYTKPPAKSSSRSLTSTSSPHYYNNKSTPTSTYTSTLPSSLIMEEPQSRNSSDSEVSNLIPSYVDILATTSGQDWLESYEFPVIPNKSNINNNSDKIAHRRTFQQQQQPTLMENPSVTVRKTRSMRDHSTSTSISSTNNTRRLRSPPPPPPSQQEQLDTYTLPQRPSIATTEKKNSMQLMNKIKRKLSFSKEKFSPTPPSQQDRLSLPAPLKPRRTVSSSILSHTHKEPIPQSPPSLINSLAEYQGYSRTASRHRSFTYSPPPPPRTSSLPIENRNESSSIIPPVPPVPKQHVTSTTTPIVKTKRTSSIIKKKKNSSNMSDNGSTGHSHHSSMTSSDTSSLIAQHHRSISPLKSTTDYTINLSQDLAQIEEDIKALEIQRQSFITATNSQQQRQQQQQQQYQEQPMPVINNNGNDNTANEPKIVGRKRGKVSHEKKNKNKKKHVLIHSILTIYIKKDFTW
jgi:hypothetical protein